MFSISLRQVFVGVSTCVAASLAVAACTRNVGLVLAIDTNVSVPDNIDEVAIVLSDDSGSVFYSNTRSARGANPISLPAQLGVAPADNVVHLVVVGFQNGAPKIFREAIGRSPSDVLAALQMGLDWEDWGSAELVGSSAPTASDAGATSASLQQGMSLLADTVSNVRTEVSINGKRIRNTCERGKTSIGGRCVDANFDPGKLPVYSEALVYGGPDRKCFPRVACFSNPDTTAVRPNVAKMNAAGDCLVDLQDSAVQLPAGFDPAGSQFNVGVPDRSEHPILAIDKATPGLAGGWSIEPGKPNVLRVPDVFCKGIKFGTREPQRPALLKFTRACDTKTRANPLCENTTSVTNIIGNIPDPARVPLPDAGVLPNLDAGLNVIVNPLLDAGLELPVDAGVLQTTIDFVRVNATTPWAPTGGGKLYAVDMLASNAAGGVKDSIVVAVTATPSSTAITPVASVVQFDGVANDGLTQLRTVTSLTGLRGLPVGSGIAPDLEVSVAPRLAAGTSRMLLIVPQVAWNPNKSELKDSFGVLPVAPTSWLGQQPLSGGRFQNATVQLDDALLGIESSLDGSTPIQKWWRRQGLESTLPRSGIQIGSVRVIAGATWTVAQRGFMDQKPVFWLTETGYQLPAHQGQDTSDPNGSVAASYFTATRQKALDLALRPEQGKKTGIILTQDLDPSGHAHLWTKGIDEGTYLAAPTAVVDNVQMDAPTGGQRSMHPYAVTQNNIAYSFAQSKSGKLILARSSLDPNGSKVFMEFLVGAQGAGPSVVYSVAVTRVNLTVNGVSKPYDRVYIASAPAVSSDSMFSVYMGDVPALVP